MQNVLCTTTSFGSSAPEVLDTLKANGLNPVLNPLHRKLKADELTGLLTEHTPIALLAGTEPVNASVLENAGRQLKVISRVGAGWDNVDRSAATRLGIQVFRTEGVLNHAVAELTLGLVLSALRHIPRHDQAVRTGQWHKHMGGMLNGKTVGIIGFGGIGRETGRLCHAFGAQIVYSDPNPVPCEWAECMPLQDLVSSSHIVCLHAAGTHVILDRAALSRCRPGVILVNTARGGMVDETALFDGLSSGRIGYACLDVFDEEPYSGALARLENVILTPHVGSYAAEARSSMERMAVANLLRGLGFQGSGTTQRDGGNQ